MELYKRIMELALQRGLFYPSNEPYGAIAGFYDYGPVGIKLKKRIEALWRQFFVVEEGNLEVESAIVTPEPVLEASGHVAEFTDPVVECQQCHKKVRADKLLEEKYGFVWDGKLESIKAFIEEKGVRCPYCGGPLGEPYNVNLMFSTSIGYDGLKGYLRPETAQGIFTAFNRLYTYAGKLPFAAAQIGRSFRNEISPRQVLIRLREFTQAELEYFYNPKKEAHPAFEKVKGERIRIKTRKDQEEGKGPSYRTLEELLQEGVGTEIMLYYLYKQWEFFKALGLREEKMWFRELRKDEIPHYSAGNIDLEVETSYGIVEISGNANRTDYDLGQHQKHSGKRFEVVEEGERFIPYVFEMSIGIDRTLFCMLEHNYRKEGKEWEWFAFPPKVAPYHVAVFPLLKKAGHPEKAKEVVAMLRREGFDTHYRESGSIGRRYARADEVGIPYAVTVDHQTLEDNTVTVRFRNSGRQERVSIERLPTYLREKMEQGMVE